MNFWRRAVAIFVLALFVPASTLAGASFHRCVSDTHDALEFVVPGLHHVATHDGHDHGSGHGAEHHGVGAFVEAMEVVLCDDTRLLTESMETPRSDAVPSPAELPLKLLPASPTNSRFGVEPARHLDRSSCAQPRTNAQLTSLRTVVLLM